MTVGLGNREVTPDALGPYVVDQLNITRHMVQEYGRYGVEEKSRIVSAIVPGVMAQTGMETAEIVQGVVRRQAGYDPGRSMRWRQEDSKD